MAKKPSPWAHASARELKRVRGICLDIDDTLSSHGKLTPQAFAALWKLKRAGFVVVPVTGRPAGWCDHIARFWPVDAVVGENGAFVFYMENGVRKRIDTPAGSSPAALRARLKKLEEGVRANFPEARWASDQAYREYDLAIDFCEDVAPWPRARVEELIRYCRDLGAHAKLSSIHVNTWFGDYDKRKGMENWLASRKGEMPAWDEWLFIGDSPNDEPLFESFKFSVGVANIQAYLERLKSPPRWITRGESGAGFVQMASRMASIMTEARKP